MRSILSLMACLMLCGCASLGGGCPGGNCGFRGPMISEVTPNRPVPDWHEARRPPNCAQPRQGSPSGADIARQQMEVIRGKLPALGVFTGSGCPPCERWKKDFAPNTAAGMQLRRWYRIELIDLDRNPKLIEVYQIELKPTFLAPGRRLEGYDNDADRVKKFLEYFDPNRKPDPERRPDPPLDPQPAPPAQPSEFEQQQWQRAVDRWNKLEEGLDRTANQTQQIAIHLQELRPNPDDITRQIIKGNGPLVERVAEVLTHTKRLADSPAKEIIKEVIRDVGPKTLAEFVGVAPHVLNLVGLTVGTGGAGGIAYAAFLALRGISRWRRGHPAYPDKFTEAAHKFKAGKRQTIPHFSIMPQPATQSSPPTIVPVAVESQELKLLHEAMAHVASNAGHPYGASVVQAIESAVQQLKLKAPHISGVR